MTTRAVLPLLVSLVSVWGFTTAPRDYSIVAVPQSQVDITDTFWAPKIETNRTVSIQHVLRKYQESGRFDSPRMIEAAAYMLSKRRDPELERQINALIERSMAGIESRLGRRRAHDPRVGQSFSRPRLPGTKRPVTLDCSMRRSKRPTQWTSFTGPAGRLTFPVTRG